MERRKSRKKIASVLKADTLSEVESTDIRGDDSAFVWSGFDVADVLASYKNNGLRKEILNEIASLPYDEAFEIAYEYLLYAGFDPNEVLIKFSEI